MGWASPGALLGLPGQPLGALGQIWIAGHFGSLLLNFFGTAELILLPYVLFLLGRGPLGPLGLEAWCSTHGRFNKVW